MLEVVNVREKVEKEVVSFGNGSIVYAPKKWIGQKVLVILQEKPFDIKAQILEVLKPYLGCVEGVFLFGSFARNEQSDSSDIDVLVIANRKFDLTKVQNFDFLVKTKEEFVSELKNDTNLFYHQLVT